MYIYIMLKFAWNLIYSRINRVDGKKRRRKIRFCSRLIFPHDTVSKRLRSDRDSLSSARCSYLFMPSVPASFSVECNRECTGCLDAKRYESKLQKLVGKKLFPYGRIRFFFSFPPVLLRNSKLSRSFIKRCVHLLRIIKGPKILIGRDITIERWLISAESSPS